MISAARLIAHKTVNGRYQSRLQMDQFPVVGHQMTHSIDSFITDSANSATALYSGHKSTVNALGVYRDSSPSPLDDPRFESIAEIFQRLTKGGVGIVSTAFIADATPAAFTAHTADRGQYGYVVDSFLNGATNFTWSNWTGPDVLLGGGAEQFIPGRTSFGGQDYYKLFASKGYNVVLNNTALNNTPNNAKTLGIFTTSNLPVWLDRNVYKQNLLRGNSPDGNKANATDVPGLKEMTLKAIDILNARHRKEGWFLMSEAASIDKQMHTLDYDRALGDLLELDDTVKNTMAKLKQLGAQRETLVLVTADHGHGFDVAGSVDTKYLNAQEGDRKKRGAIGTYRESGLSQYVVPGSPQDTGSGLQFSEGAAFPANWDPRYTLFSAVGANPDHRENYQVHKDGPRLPAVNTSAAEDNYIVNYKDAVTGFVVNGTLPVNNAQGVHSLTDVPVFAQGPCQEMFGGVYNNIDIFFNMAACLGLARSNMDPITAFNLAAGVIQVVDISFRAVSKCRELLKDGSLAEHRETAEIVDALANTTGSLGVSIRQLATPRSKDDSEILELSTKCSRTAGELLTELNRLKLGQGGLRQAIAQSVRAIRSKQFLQQKQSDLKEYQQVLDTRILIRLDARSLKESHDIEALDQSVRDLALDVENGRTTFSQLLTNQTREIQDHVNFRFDEHERVMRGWQAQQQLMKSLLFQEILSRQDQISNAFGETYGWVFEFPVAESRKRRPWSNFRAWLVKGNGAYWIPLFK
ncbi:MAG: hypothetical protein Q9182_000563 [Xanthomendoza sp. 2 TL-2023]